MPHAHNADSASASPTKLAVADQACEIRSRPLERGLPLAGGWTTEIVTAIILFFFQPSTREKKGEPTSTAFTNDPAGNRHDGVLDIARGFWSWTLEEYRRKWGMVLCGRADL